MQIIQNIALLMKRKNVTPAQMERDIGIRASTFVSWKNGSQPSADKLLKIIQYLEVSPNELFGYEPTVTLTDNEKEMLELFQQLPDREQIKFIGRLEDVVEKYKKGE